MADDELVTITSHDGDNFAIEVGIAKLSNTLKHLIDEAGIENAIPLPNISTPILTGVIKYLTHHYNNTGSIPATDHTHKGLKDICEWDKNFCPTDLITLYDLILAANYLDIAELLHLSAKTLVNSKIHGFSTEEMRENLGGLVDDFTPEQKEEIRIENEWCTFPKKE